MGAGLVRSGIRCLLDAVHLLQDQRGINK